MSFSWQSIKLLFGENSSERKKTLYLIIAFFLIIASYTLVRELRNTVFVNIVGKEYAPWARIWAMITLVPAIMFYSRLVDILRRHQLLYVYTIMYSVGLLLIAYFLAHPTIGLTNEVTGKYRLFGWFVYFFLEGFSPFVVSLGWAFANSITDAEFAKSKYSLLTAGSKVGGMLAAVLGIVILRCAECRIHWSLSDIVAHQLLFCLAALFLLLVPFVIHQLMKDSSSVSLHGYEASYQAERQLQREVRKNQSVAAQISSMFAGLRTLLRSPYAFGIFGLVFFWEVLNSVFGYQRLGIGKASTTCLAGFSCYLLQHIFFLHLIGLIIALFGRQIVMRVGERWGLLLVPLINGVLLVYYLASQSPTAVGIVYVLIAAMNYAFAYPLRETLYIPTTKEMKFKTKSWIDAFGAKIARGFGSSFNIAVESLTASGAFIAHAGFFAGLVGVWLVISQLLGRRYERAVKHNEVIDIKR